MTPSLLCRMLKRSFSVSSRVYPQVIHVQKSPVLPTSFVLSSSWYRRYAAMIVKTPTMADSITEGVLSSWEKKVGDTVSRDEVVANIETDKITLPVNSPEDGVIMEVFAQQGDTVVVGSDLFKLDVGAAPKKSEPPVQKKKKEEEEPKVITTQSKSTSTVPEAAKKEEPDRQSKSNVVDSPQPSIPKTASQSVSTAPPPSPPLNVSFGFERSEKKTRMTPMRQKIAQRLKESQQVAASLTTFNEVDMSAIMELRTQYKDEILKKHNVKFGFMSAFVKAASTVLIELPMVNSRIEGSDIITPNHVDMSVAVATPKGLVTPVLKNTHLMGLIEIEKALAEIGERARNNQITMGDLSGGTFTISNGGVFGSMMGTPIINLPQSAILGMHAIKDRPVVVQGQIVVRPMMYLALTYDHRIVDGREAVLFLVRLKALLEDPRRLLVSI